MHHLRKNSALGVQMQLDVLFHASWTGEDVGGDGRVGVASEVRCEGSDAVAGAGFGAGGDDFVAACEGVDEGVADTRVGYAWEHVRRWRSPCKCW